MFRLMIKQHNKTNLKYLCVTKRDNYESYLGSGVYWRNHLRRYGEDITTEVLFESDNMAEISKFGYSLSVELDIIHSDDWANLTYETGYDEKALNFKHWWENLTEEDKLHFVTKRNRSIKENHFIHSDNCVVICDKISKSLKNRWKTLSEDEKHSQMAHLWDGWKIWWNSTESLPYKHDLIERATKQLKQIRNSYSAEEWSNEVSRRRKSLSPEKKKIRAEKCKKQYLTGKHDDLFERYSTERIGAGNPAAKKVIFDGIIYPTIREASDRTNVPYHRVRKLIKELNNDKNCYID